MHLTDAYKTEGAAELLYRLLQERPPEANISHRKMPTWAEHLAFFNSKPYLAWYIIHADDEPVGACYLTHMREVGLFVLEKHRSKGLGGKALDALAQKHPGRLLANIAPGNDGSQKFFEQRGFKLIQHTYELD